MVENLLATHVLVGKSATEAELLLGSPTFLYPDHLAYQITNTWTCSNELAVFIQDDRVTAATPWPCK